MSDQVPDGSQPLPSERPAWDDAGASADEPTRDLGQVAPESVPDRHQTPAHSSQHVTWSVGAASDIGLRHEVNQDAYRVTIVPASPTPPAVLVIADGVSSAINSDIAADAAAASASRHLIGYLSENPSAAAVDLAEAMADAFSLANTDIAATQTPVGSCTLIAGVVSSEGVTVGNVGDSRAYWVGDDGTAVALSVDDSIAQVRIDMGMTREAAEHGAHSHAITRWLGPQATDVTPRVLTYRPPFAGWVVVCSDGLWNYASEATDLARVVQEALAASASSPHGSTAEEAARALVGWALGQGGRDNVTVALARWDVPTGQLAVAADTRAAGSNSLGGVQNADDADDADPTIRIHRTASSDPDPSISPAPHWENR